MNASFANGSSPTSISSAPYLYGPHNYLDRETFIWNRLRANETIRVPGTSQTLIQFCHVETLARFVRELVLTDSIEPGIYNVGEQRFYTFMQFIDILAGLVGATPKIEQVFDDRIAAREYFPFRDAHLILDVGKGSRASSAWEVPLAEGMGQRFSSSRITVWNSFRRLVDERCPG